MLNKVAQHQLSYNTSFHAGGKNPFWAKSRGVRALGSERSGARPRVRAQNAASTPTCFSLTCHVHATV